MFTLNPCCHQADGKRFGVLCVLAVRLRSSGLYLKGRLSARGIVILPVLMRGIFRITQPPSIWLYHPFLRLRTSCEAVFLYGMDFKEKSKIFFISPFSIAKYVLCLCPVRAIAATISASWPVTRNFQRGRYYDRCCVPR